MEALIEIEIGIVTVVKTKVKIETIAKMIVEQAEVALPAPAHVLDLEVGVEIGTVAAIVTVIAIEVKMKIDGILEEVRILLFILFL